MAPNLDPEWECSVAILPMQLILALAPGFQPIDSQVPQAISPALVELTVEDQSYATLLALRIWHRFDFLAPHSLGPSRILCCAPVRWMPLTYAFDVGTTASFRVKPSSFPIYHILVIIFNSRQAGLLLYVDSHGTSDHESLEKSRGTLP